MTEQLHGTLHHEITARPPAAVLLEGRPPLQLLDEVSLHSELVAEGPVSCELVGPQIVAICLGGRRISYLPYEQVEELSDGMEIYMPMGLVLRLYGSEREALAASPSFAAARRWLDAQLEEILAG